MTKQLTPIKFKEKSCKPRDQRDILATRAWSIKAQIIYEDMVGIIMMDSCLKSRYVV